MKNKILIAGIFSIFLLGAKAQVDFNSLPPLDELGNGKWNGYTGGLYPDGSNTMPAAFYTDAVNIAKSIEPLDANGAVSPQGKIVLLTVGASTIAMFSEGIEKLIYDVPGVNKRLLFINGGVGGQDLNKIYDPNAKYWQLVNSRLASEGITNEQVQVVWFQEDDLRNQTAAFPDRAELLAKEFTEAIQKLKVRYPNLKLLYLTGRHNTEFIPADANDKHREPRPYLNGWATKFIIEDQIKGSDALTYKGENAKAPLIMWGPYFWTQGEKPRADGYTFTRDLVSNDGVHPTEKGKLKIANDMLNFWKTDAVSQIWFLENPNIVAVNADTSMDANTSFKLYVMDNLLDEIEVKNKNAYMRLMFLKDSTVVYDKTIALNTDSINVMELRANTYKYVMLYGDSLTKAGEFKIDEKYNIEKMELKAQNNLQDTGSHRVPLKDSAQAKNFVGINEPAWFINGSNKLPKLIRLLGNDPNKYAKAVFTDPDGNVKLVVEDVLRKHTVVNDLIPTGNYVLKFYDADGNQIIIDRDIPQYQFIK